MGHPPFLGGSKKRGELGSACFNALESVFKGRVPGGADLVCYWFERARRQLKHHGLGAAGFVATQAFRSGSNRKVLEAVTQEFRICDAWADEEGVNDGAAVRVSIISMSWSATWGLVSERARPYRPPWQIEFDPAAAKELKSLERLVAQRLLSFLRTRVAKLDDPRSSWS